jgi:hypothetical protein
MLIEGGSAAVQVIYTVQRIVIPEDEQKMLKIRDVYPDPGLRFLSIPDPRSNKKTNRGMEQFYFVLPFCSHKYHMPVL